MKRKFHRNGQLRGGAVDFERRTRRVKFPKRRLVLRDKHIRPADQQQRLPVGSRAYSLSFNLKFTTWCAVNNLLLATKVRTGWLLEYIDDLDSEISEQE